MATSIKQHVVEVVRHKGPIVLPEDMTVPTAIKVLQEKDLYDGKQVVLSETIPCFWTDGALALQRAIVEQYGLAMQTESMGMWGPNPPQIINIEIDVDKTVKCPWGAFSLPGVKGYVETGMGWTPEGTAQFNLSAEVTHAAEDQIKRLFARVREIAMSESIYKGKALTVRFFQDNGKRLPMPEIKFLKVTDHPPIFSRELEDAIATNVLTPIKHTEVVRKAGVPLKRGVLLAGVYGTGKTLTAGMIAKTCMDNGWTFLYVKNIQELKDALIFAQAYQPCVVFGEDVDRAAGSERTEDVNALLNVLDGINTKAGEVMTVLTSNHPEAISPAMRRPGRIDVVLEVRPPDAQAAERLMRFYGKNMIAPSEGLTEAGKAAAGQIPAVIREIVERAKLESIQRTGGAATGSFTWMIIEEDLVKAARVLIAEQQLFRPTEPNEHRQIVDGVSRWLYSIGVDNGDPS